MHVILPSFTCVASTFPFPHIALSHTPWSDHVFFIHEKWAKKVIQQLAMDVWTQLRVSSECDNTFIINAGTKNTHTHKNVLKLKTIWHNTNRIYSTLRHFEFTQWNLHTLHLRNTSLPAISIIQHQLHFSFIHLKFKTNQPTVLHSHKSWNRKHVLSLTFLYGQ